MHHLLGGLLVGGPARRLPQLRVQQMRYVHAGLLLGRRGVVAVIHRLLLRLDERRVRRGGRDRRSTWRFIQVRPLGSRLTWTNRTLLFGNNGELDGLRCCTFPFPQNYVPDVDCCVGDGEGWLRGNWGWCWGDFIALGLGLLAGLTCCIGLMIFFTGLGRFINSLCDIP